MRTRRSVLVSVGGLITLTGCSQQSSQPSEESDAEGASGEFGIDQFRVGGENPDEYEAEFISGGSPESVADELTPEVSYRISGASGEVETEVRYEYSDSTIPEGEPLDETVAGDTHNGSGEYKQAPSMPDSLVSEVVENPKNLAVTFRATDTGSEGQASREYELNFADSYIEQIHQEHFNQERFDISDSKQQKVSVEGDIIDISFKSDYSVGTQGFNNQLGNVVGLYAGNVDRTRIPYKVDLNITDTSGDKYKKEFGKSEAESYLKGNTSINQFKDGILFNQLWTEMDQN